MHEHVAVQGMQVAFVCQFRRDIMRAGLNQTGGEERLRIRGTLTVIGHFTRGVGRTQLAGILEHALEEALVYGDQLIQIA